jgi:hypothetical protein
MLPWDSTTSMHRWVRVRAGGWMGEGEGEGEGEGGWVWVRGKEGGGVR